MVDCFANPSHLGSLHMHVCMSKHIDVTHAWAKWGFKNESEMDGPGMLGFTCFVDMMCLVALCQQYKKLVGPSHGAGPGW